MTSKELLYVKTIAEEKSISKAAKKLYIAQPSLSQSIQRLEENLGTQLFNRTASGLTLTQAGERYFIAASQILKIYQDLENEISDLNNSQTGKIHMGITNHLGSLVLPLVLPQFMEKYPRVEIYITEDNTASLEQLLLAGALDFAIMHAPKENFQPQLQYELLGNDPFLLVMKEDHPLLARSEMKKEYPYPVLNLKLLKQEAFLMLPKEQRIRQVSSAALKRAGISHPNIALTLKNFETACMLAAQGLGIAFVPNQYTRLLSIPCKATFCSIDQQYDASWDMCIATAKGTFLSRADRLLIENTKTVWPTL